MSLYTTTGVYRRQSKFVRPALGALPPYCPDELDLKILHTVHTNKEATAEIIWLYNGHSLQTIQRRLTALWHNHYLNRWGQLDRRGQRGGSDKQVYFLDTEGAKLLTRVKKARIRPYKFHHDEGKYHLAHRLGTRRIAALAFGACARHSRIELAYDFPDKKFRVELPGLPYATTNRVKISPDRLFGLRGCFENNPEKIQNCFVEYQRPKRRTLESRQPLSLDEEKSILDKFRSYVLLKKIEPHKNLKAFDDYPGVRDLNNFVVLVVCDGHSPTQALNLMATARKSFGASTPLRIFWFARPDYFEATNPAQTFFAPTWRSCKQGDNVSRSLVSNETTRVCPWIISRSEKDTFGD